MIQKVAVIVHESVHERLMQDDTVIRFEEIRETGCREVYHTRSWDDDHYFIAGDMMIGNGKSKQYLLDIGDVTFLVSVFPHKSWNRNKVIYIHDNVFDPKSVYPTTEPKIFKVRV